MLTKMWKICILTFVIVPAVWAAATSTSSSNAAAAAITTAATTTTTLNITNDLQSSSNSHAHSTVATAQATSEMKRSEMTTKTLTEMQQTTPATTTAAAAVTSATEQAIVDNSSSSSSSTTTSTATPTTTATTSTTTTTTKRITTSAAAGNEADKQISNRVAATAMPATTTTTTTTSTTTEAALADELMTSNVPPLASLGSVFDRLYRISVNEQVQQQPLELEEEESTVPAPLQIQMQAAASYQVAETLADLNEEERARYGPMLSQQPTASKLNIVDLYPMKPADFQPIIKVDNEELLRQRTIFTQPENAAEYKQNLMPNEVELQLRPLAAATSATTAAATVASDFTGKLLAEQDDLITEIERKFRLPESTTTTAKPTTAAAAATRLAAGNTFLDRRVKKSFEFPLQHRASDVMALPHIDFANTKFNTDAGEESKTAQAQAASHPEFSTTKFYNSKELYNEMLLHSKRKLMKPTAAATATTATTTTATTTTTTAAAATTTNAATTASVVASEATTSARVTLTPAATTFDSNTAAITTTTASVTESPPRKQQQQLKRAKLLLKALKPPAAAEKLEVVATKVKITAAAAAAVSSTPSPLQAINLAKSSLKPIARPRILSPLQEKINSLDCDIVAVPQDAHLWRGNETHELLLPLVTTEHCTPGERCTPNVLTWEGTAEIQSGDILIVEINDAMLNIAHEQNNTNSQSAAHAAQVYQVTRPGHDHCDVTEGVLLDITPLVVDGRKLVTLYDKDLTEGINMLIVVSELWGAQCVRLKVTTKTDNCGEGADCSGKGVCYSDAAMEEYECQCCSGFAGAYCEEIDACNPSPCTNNGICVDLSQGHEGNSYQCLCPYGYAGKNCQYESDPCNPADCMNGGSCVGNSTHFRCDCTPGFTGPLCQHSLNECESSPCLHGICVDQEDGFRCFCQPGFAGELCNFEYNECESNPCQNSGECIDHIGSYECRCTKGYTGNRCQIKVDFCANKPCPEGHHCIDHGNDFSCECPGGRNGPDCNQMPRTYFQQCSVNPCTHGGTCWSSGDSFYCACRPGYTGTMCEDEFVVETVVSSSEFIVDDANARNFNDKTFGSSVVLKSPIELHNAYFAAGVLAAAIFIVAIVVTICHCKVNQTYRKFSTRSSSFIPILGFSRRPKMQGKLNKHWLSGKGLNAPAAAAAAGAAGAGGAQRDTNNCNPQSQSTRHLPPNAHSSGSGGSAQGTLGGQLHERPFQRHLAMNLENDMYYTVDFSENSQHSPLIQ